MVPRWGQGVQAMVRSFAEGERVGRPLSPIWVDAWRRLLDAPPWYPCGAVATHFTAMSNPGARPSSEGRRRGCGDRRAEVRPSGRAGGLSALERPFRSVAGRIGKAGGCSGVDLLGLLAAVDGDLAWLGLLRDGDAQGEHP